VTTALLLDRDGTLMEDVGYPNDPTQVQLIPGAAETVRALARLGFVPAVVSNQSGIARRFITPAQASTVHDRFVEQFAKESGLKLPCFYCPHGPNDGCDCRKPKPGLLIQAKRALGMTGRPTVMIGDKPSDIAAGKAAGAVTVWLSFGREYPAGELPPAGIAADWSDVASTLLRSVANRAAA